MKEKPITIKGTSGIRNAVPEDRLGINPDTKLIELTTASNIDIDETGRTKRRMGTNRLVTCSSAHSLFSNGETALFVDNTSLKSLDKDFSTVTVLRTVVAGLRMRYTYIPSKIFFSNGIETGCYERGIVRTWGIAVPGLPTTVETIGELPAGQYTYSMTYVRRDGQESGAPLGASITIADNKGISFSAIPSSTDPDVITKRIYISSHDGEIMYMALELPNAAATAVYRGYKEGVLPLVTQFKGPPPAGTALETYNGRGYIAKDNILWFTDLFSYELVDYRENFIQFDDKITTVAASQNGLFIGTTTETFFLSGDSADVLGLSKLADYGTVPNTEVELDSSKLSKGDGAGVLKGWMSNKGFCVGLAQGQMINLSANLYNIPAAKEGATLYKDSSTPQIVVSLFN